jgi:pimeloyl-ACP methyl ester carboxylesterase
MTFMLKLPALCAAILLTVPPASAGSGAASAPDLTPLRCASPAQKVDYEAGEEYSYLNMVGLKGDGMMSQVDLPKLGVDFAIPMFFIAGAQDLLATPDVAQRYYDSLKAPQKHLVVLEHAGHDPNQDVIDAEYKILKERILPLTK